MLTVHTTFTGTGTTRTVIRKTFASDTIYCVIHMYSFSLHAGRILNKHDPVYLQSQFYNVKED